MNRRAFAASAALAGLSAILAPRASARIAADAKADFRARNTAVEMSASNFHAARKFASVKHGKIAYLDEGAGPALLFIHGFPLNGFQWRGAIGRLNSVRRCIAPDLLGLGYTNVANGQSLAPEAQAEMLLALMDHLGVRKFDLIANDSGGAVAQLLALADPDRINSMLLTNCDVETDWAPAALTPVIALARENQWAHQWLKPWLADKELARSAEGLGGLCYEDPNTLTDDIIECYLRPLVETPRKERMANGYAAALGPNALGGAEASLRKFKAPVKIVWGEADPIFSAESPAYLDRLFPRSKGVRRLPQAKLFFPEEYPHVIAEEAMKLWP